MSLPTSGDKFSELIEYVRRAQEASATLAHLASEDRQRAMIWLAVSENFKRVQHLLTAIAAGKYNGRSN